MCWKKNEKKKENRNPWSSFLIKTANQFARNSQGLRVGPAGDQFQAVCQKKTRKDFPLFTLHFPFWRIDAIFALLRDRYPSHKSLSCYDECNSYTVRRLKCTKVHCSIKGSNKFTAAVSAHCRLESRKLRENNHSKKVGPTEWLVFYLVRPQKSFE